MKVSRIAVALMGVGAVSGMLLARGGKESKIHPAMTIDPRWQNSQQPVRAVRLAMELTDQPKVSVPDDPKLPLENIQPRDADLPAAAQPADQPSGSDLPLPEVPAEPVQAIATLPPGATAPATPNASPPPAALIPATPSTAPGGANDPEKAAREFVEKNQKVAESELASLKKEAEALRNRLQKVEAAIRRWESVAHALKQTEGITSSKNDGSWKAEPSTRRTQRVIDDEPTNLSPIPAGKPKARLDRDASLTESDSLDDLTPVAPH